MPVKSNQGSNAVAMGFQAGHSGQSEVMQLLSVHMPVMVIREVMQLRWVLKPVNMSQVEANAVAIGNWAGLNTQAK
jgi:hypothetical protein